jgi:hypothetical protein
VAPGKTRNMAQDLIAARVKEFTKEHGFGIVTLADGREVPFDVTACTFEPKKDDEVRVRLGTSRLGQTKITYVEPVNGPKGRGR